MVAASRDWMTGHAASPKARSLHQGLEQLLHGGVGRGVITGERRGSVSVWEGLSECVVGGAYLMKVTWSSYIQGCSSRLGYFPNGGTMRLKTSAMHTKTAGNTICRGGQHETSPGQGPGARTRGQDKGPGQEARSSFRGQNQDQVQEPGAGPGAGPGSRPCSSYRVQRKVQGPGPFPSQGTGPSPDPGSRPWSCCRGQAQVQALRGRRGRRGVPGQRSPSWSAWRTGSASTSGPRTAAASDSNH